MHTKCWRWPHHRSIQSSKVRKALHTDKTTALMDMFMFTDYIVFFFPQIGEYNDAQIQSPWCFYGQCGVFYK